MREWWSNLHRLGRIARVSARHLLAHWRGRFAARRSAAPDAGPGGPERLRMALEELGGTFIKLGQMLALQPDILPLDYCNALFKLLDRVEPCPAAEIERIVAAELGRPPREIFDHFETTPLAAASIGQVHRAALGGREWVVKVQRPGVESDFDGDIRLMSALVRWIRRLRLAPLAWLVEPLSEFVAWTREELDYRVEARYMDRLRRNAAGQPAERVPEVLWELSTRRVLVIEYLDGLPVLDHLRAIESGDRVTARRLAALGFVPDAFARNIIDNFLGDAFRHGIFHADLHPANLMILPGNVVGYLDFGITGVLSMHSRRNLVALTLAYTRGDLDGMCEAFFLVSSFDRRSRPRRFRRELGRLAESWYEAGGGGGRRRLKKSFTLVMLDMLRLSRATGVWPERDVIKYIRSAIAIDGLIHRFAPGFDVGRHLERVCARQLQGAGLEAVLSRDHLLAGSLAGAHLLRDGPLRAGRAVDRLLAGGLTLRGAVEPPAAAGRLRDRALRQAGFVLAAGALAALPLGAAEPGLNPFSVAILLVVAGVAALLDTTRRLLRAGAGKETLHA